MKSTFQIIIPDFNLIYFDLFEPLGYTLCKAICRNVLFILPGQSVWVTLCLSKAICHNVVLLLFILLGQSVWVTLCLSKAICHNVVLLFILPDQSVWVTLCLSKAICHNKVHTNAYLF